MSSEKEIAANRGFFCEENGKNGPRCGIPCDALVCRKNRKRTAMHDFGAFRLTALHSHVAVFHRRGSLLTPPNLAVNALLKGASSLEMSCFCLATSTRLASSCMCVSVIDLRTPPPATEPRDGPARNFHEKYRKNTPRPEILVPEFTLKMPRKYRKKYHQNAKNDRFWYFFGLFGVFVGFSKSATQTRYRENAENADVPPTPGKQGSEKIPQNENAENADMKTRKMRKIRMTGFNVTGFR